MGFMSRRVLPVCGSFCVCCPALRSRSRQPVKRYRKLIADIFPKTQEESPNDRKIAKLCDYASKNPLRIPKIAASLEQRGYNELRNEHFGSVRVVMSAFTKLASSCKDQMPLFAVSAINMIRALLDQARQDEMRVLGCSALYEFTYSQVDGTYVHHLDGLLPSLCALAEESGEERRRRQLRSAGLRALSAMVWFMGEHSHISSEFDHVVFVVMDNYERPFIETGENTGKGEAYHYWVKEVLEGDGRAAMPTLTDAFTKLSFRKDPSCLNDPSYLTSTSETPKVWAHVCIEKLAHLAKEASTTRRVLEPMFQYFDSGKHWSPEMGLASAVLQEMLHFMAKSGNDCFLLAFLVRHLDYPSVSQSLQTRANIVKIVSSLARHSKSQATVVEIRPLSDLLRHLQNSLQGSIEASSDVELGGNKLLQSAIEECLLELVKKVGEANSIFEMMALALEKLSIIAVVARTTINSLLILARIMASLPGQLQMQQNFPEALLHELLLTMVHPDIDTRIGTHHIFETVLVPTWTWLGGNQISPALHAFSNDAIKRPTINSTAVLLEKFRKERNDSQVLSNSPSEKLGLSDVKMLNGVVAETQDIIENRRARYAREIEPKVESGSPFDRKEMEMNTVRLSGDQAVLLFSTLWSEANMDNNLPENYEAICQTFSLTLLFSAAKNSSHRIFVRAFQLALSLRTVALDTNECLSPSRKRSLFTLSTAMLSFAARIYDIPCIIAKAKAPIERGLVDPFFEFVDEERLKVTTRIDRSHFGTPAEDASSTESLARVRMHKDFSNEALVSLIQMSLPVSLQMEYSSLPEELLQMFCPNDGFAFGLDLQSKISRPWTKVLFQKSMSLNEAMEPKDDLISDTSYTDLPEFLSTTPIHTPSPNVIGVSQLLESVLERAGQVAGVSIATTPLPYAAVATQCEAFGTNARRKIFIWTKLDTDDKAFFLNLPEQKHCETVHPAETKPKGTDMMSYISMTPLLTSTQKPWQTLQLPPVSHYDNFLKAAGC